MTLCRNLSYSISNQSNSTPFFGQLEDSEFIAVINILAHNALKHQIIMSDKRVLPIIVPAPYVFNLSADSQYDDTEFK